MSGLTDFLKLIKPAGLEKFSLPIYNKALDDIDAAIRKLPRGVMRHSRSTNLSSGMSAVTIMNHITPFTFEPGRKYRIIFAGNFVTTNNSDPFAFGISTAPINDAPDSTANLTPIGRNYTFINPLANAGMDHTLVTYHEVASVTTVQLKARIQRVFGGGSVQVSGFDWTIEDAGAI